MNFIHKTKYILISIFATCSTAAFCATNSVSTVSSQITPHADWNFIIPISFAIVGGIVAFIRYMSETRDIKEETLRNNAVTKEINKHIEGLSEKLNIAIKEREKEKEIQNITNDELKRSITDLQKDLALMKLKSEHDNKSIDQLKEENKEIIKKLDKLLADLFTYLN